MMNRWHIGSDNLFNKHRKERIKRKENNKNIKSNKWLIVCEGKKTEPNYFNEVVREINKLLSKEDKLKVKIIGKGVGTLSLLDTVSDVVSNEVFLLYLIKMILIKKILIKPLKYVIKKAIFPYGPIKL